MDVSSRLACSQALSPLPPNDEREAKEREPGTRLDLSIRYKQSKELQIENYKAEKCYLVKNHKRFRHSPSLV